MRPTPVIRAALAGYALGSVSSAGVAGRARGVDLRTEGTGNPGAMNARRLLGRRVGLAVVAADIAKGAAAGLAGRALAGAPGAHIASVASVAGHCYPAHARFRGGMGVATSFGQCLATFPVYAPFDLAVAVAAYRLPRRGRPVPTSLVASATLWILAGVVWWRRRLPNLWGPRPTGALPAANAATAALIVSRGIAAARRRGRTELDAT